MRSTIRLPSLAALLFAATATAAAPAIHGPKASVMGSGGPHLPAGSDWSFPDA